MNLPKDEQELTQWLAAAFVGGWLASDGSHCAPAEKVGKHFGAYLKQLKRKRK